MEKIEQPNILGEKSEKIEKKAEEIDESGNPKNAVNYKTDFIKRNEEEAEKERKNIEKMMEKTREIKKRMEDLLNDE